MDRSKPSLRHAATKVDGGHGRGSAKVAGPATGRVKMRGKLDGTMTTIDQLPVAATGLSPA
jgi:hypothetical protein